MRRKGHCRWCLFVDGVPWEYCVQVKGHKGRHRINHPPETNPATLIEWEKRTKVR